MGRQANMRLLLDYSLGMDIEIECLFLCKFWDLKDLQILKGGPKNPVKEAATKPEEGRGGLTLSVSSVH